VKGIKSFSKQIKKVYDSESKKEMKEILNLLLGESSRYLRIGSYFSSTSYISLSEGLSKFIFKGGKMKLIINCELSAEDYKEVELAQNEKKLPNIFERDIDNIKSAIELNSAKILGELIASKRLEIRVTTGKHNELMHIKTGIIIDDLNNQVAFSGSANETGSAYEKNIEQLTFFKDWDPVEKDYVEEYRKRFEKFWSNLGENSITYTLSEALKNKLIKIRPRNKKELENVHKDRFPTINEDEDVKKLIKPYSYQLEAMDSWTNNKNRGIIELPTGCGKTKTAIFCKERLEKTNKIVTFIFAPTDTICNQWKEEFGEHHEKICKIYSNPKWKVNLKKDILDLNLGVKDELVVIGTYKTIYNPFLIEQIKKIKNYKKFIIADEVHSTGTNKISEGLIEDYDFRLGLSATPKRWLDKEGSKIIFDYFGDSVFDKVTLFDAIYKLKVLSRYNYHLIHVTLNEKESQDYADLTIKIRKQLSMAKTSPGRGHEEIAQRLSEKRANIIKNCKEKLMKFPEIIPLIKSERTIIFVSPEQRKKIINLISNDIIYHQFTYHEKNKQERETILKNFKNNNIKCLIAIKCLDEGLDVGPVKNGVIMASSGNPKEFIQRRGRLLRKSKEKEFAEIYDFFVTPDKSLMGDYATQIKKEILRIEEFSKSAQNEEAVTKQLNSIRDELGI
jgi:superfamily II DNA or RNA helicase